MKYPINIIGIGLALGLLSGCAKLPHHTNPYDPGTPDEPLATDTIHLSETDVIEITENSIEFEWTYTGDDDRFQAFHVFRKDQTNPEREIATISAAYLTQFKDFGRDLDTAAPSPGSPAPGLTPGTAFRYRVEMELKNGVRVSSNEVTLETASPVKSISFGTPLGLQASAYGNTANGVNFALVAFAKDGNEYSLRIDTLYQSANSTTSAFRETNFQFQTLKNIPLSSSRDTFPGFIKELINTYNSNHRAVWSDTIPLSLPDSLGSVQISYEILGLALGLPRVVLALKVNGEVQRNRPPPNPPILKTASFLALVLFSLDADNKLVSVRNKVFEQTMPPTAPQTAEVLEFKDLKIRHDSVFALAAVKDPFQPNPLSVKLFSYQLDSIQGFFNPGAPVPVRLNGLRMRLVLTTGDYFVLASGGFGYFDPAQGAIVPLTFNNSSGRAEIIEPQDLLVTTDRRYIIDISQGGVMVFNAQNIFISIWTKANRKDLNFVEGDQICGNGRFAIFSTGDQHWIANTE
jgi:hypothetical protein